MSLLEPPPAERPPHDDGMTQLFHRVRSEFLEMPGLRLTPAQAAHSGPWIAQRREHILDGLTTAGFLSEEQKRRLSSRIGGVTVEIDDRTEWLEADGQGGFASGTTAGIRTRRYHALLLTAVTPPTGRVVLVNGFDAWVDTAAGSFALSSQRYAPDVIHPDGASRITDFSGDPWPTWYFEAADGTRVSQEIFVQHDTGAVAIVWTLVRGEGPVVLRARPFVSGRDYHSMHHENGAFRFDAVQQDATVRFRSYEGLPDVVSLSNGDYRQAADWYRRFLYTAERERGLDDTEDLASPGEFSWPLAAPGEQAVWVLMVADAGRSEARTKDEVVALVTVHENR